MFVLVTWPISAPLPSDSNKSVPSVCCAITQPLLFNRSNTAAGFPPGSASPLERIQKLIVPVLELKLVLGGTTIWLGTLVVKLITPVRVTLAPSVLVASQVAPLLN